VNGITPARPFWAIAAETALAAFTCFIVSVLMVNGRVRPALLTALLVIALSWAATANLFMFTLRLFDPVTLSLLVIGTLALSGLPWAARRALGANAASPAPSRKPVPAFEGVERREVTALVCEIRDLEVLTEVYHDSPEAISRLIAKVLGTAADVVRAHRGAID